MESKKYSSFAQIELELEILKLEKELNLQKIKWNVEKTKEDLMPKNILKSFFGNYKSTLPNPSGRIFKIVIPLIIHWFEKRKRGV
ncbi:MAG TPA: DUF6327 family protein [Flavobacterium sp.]|nr:DUF6327 family protein [Flavobacterium sp.]